MLEKYPTHAIDWVVRVALKLIRLGGQVVRQVLHIEVSVG